MKEYEPLMQCTVMHERTESQLSVRHSCNFWQIWYQLGELPYSCGHPCKLEQFHAVICDFLSRILLSTLSDNKKGRSGRIVE